MHATSNRTFHTYQGWTERGQASIFLTALILPLIVGTGLFLRHAPVMAPAALVTGMNVSAIAKATVSSRAASTRPTAVPDTSVPLSASLEAQPTPSASAAATPRVVSPSPTVIPSRVAPALIGRVANTGGDGVFLRHTPVLTDRWIAWPDNTVFVLVGNESEGDGQHWLEVRDPKDDVGWVPAQFINR